MKKTLYIILLAVEALSLIIPFMFLIYFQDFLIGGLALLVVAAVYAFLGIRAFKQKKAGDEAALKKSRIMIALVCPVIWAAFIAYFFFICSALGII